MKKSISFIFAALFAFTLTSTITSCGNDDAELTPNSNQDSQDSQGGQSESVENKENKAQYVDVLCLDCNGNGLCSTCDGSGKGCTTCHGNGACPDCNGTGGICETCNSTGKCYLCNGSGNCGECFGSGREVCYICDGLGRNIITKETCYKCGGSGRIQCWLCRGTGDCDVCDGRRTCNICKGNPSCNTCRGNKKCITCGGDGHCFTCKNSDGKCLTCKGKGNVVQKAVVIDLFDGLYEYNPEKVNATKVENVNTSWGIPDNKYYRFEPTPNNRVNIYVTYSSGVIEPNKRYKLQVTFAPETTDYSEIGSNISVSVYSDSEKLTSSNYVTSGENVSIFTSQEFVVLTNEIKIQFGTRVSTNEYRNGTYNFVMRVARILLLLDEE